MGKKRSAPESQSDATKRQKKEGKEVKEASKSNGKAKDVSNGNGLLFVPRADWHAAELLDLPVIDKPNTPRALVIQSLLDHATSLLEAENARYAAANTSKNSSTKFMKEIMTSGTLEDKVSALTLVIQESPLHNTKAFESLLNLARKKNRNQAIMALGALKDLLGSGVVLPPERKLRAFGRQPALVAALQGKVGYWKASDGLPGEIRDVHLIFWAYEDWLKRTYFDMLQVLEGWCNDEVPYARNRAVTFVWELLKEKSEQEENLLRLLVNKLGDTDKKVASRASHLLLQLQVVHPVMKGVVIGAIESDLLFRPGQSLHARYYAIITLNQTILSQKEQELANKLLDIYFSIFVGILKREDPVDDERKFAPNGQFQGGGGTPGKKARQKKALKDAEREAKVQAELQIKDRLIAQVLTGINRAFPFADAQSSTMDTHLDTLFRITHSANFNTSIQALMLIFQIAATKQQTADRYYRTLYESLLDPRLLVSSKQIMYLNLLYRSLKADINIKRVQAFVKRLLQIVTLHEPSFACGVLYLIYELQVTFPAIKTMLTEPETLPDDEEEKYVDIDQEGAEVSAKTQANTSTSVEAYNPRKREPEYSHADRSCLWELIPLVAHYHPSVSLFASRLLQSQAFDKQKPDPTTFTLIHFLDRFIYRNARTKASGLRGSSLMQPLAGTSAADLLVKQRAGHGHDALNTEAFWAKSKDDIRPDEVFFHDYFAKSGKASAKSRAEKRAKKAEEGSEAEETDEDEEKEIWKALVGSRPDIEDEGAELEDEDDDDLDIAEFMEDEDETDDEEGGVPIDRMGGVSFHGFEGEDEDAEEGVQVGEAASDDGEFGLADLEDDDEGAFVDSDEELPEDIDIPELPEKDIAKDVKSKDKKKRKRSLKSLPVFASAEDYAKLLGDDDDEDL